MNSKLTSPLWVLIILLLASGCRNQADNTLSAKQTAAPVDSQSIPTVIATPPSAIDENDAPIAIVSLEGQMLVFDCINRAGCLPNIDLAGYILLDAPFELGWVFYWNPSSLYVIINATHSVVWERNILHINPQTGEVKTTKLSTNFVDLHYKVVGGQLVIAEYTGSSILVFRDDLSTMRVDVGFPIRSLIGVNERQVIVLNTVPVEQGNIAYFDVSVVDIVSGESKKETFKLPGLELNPTPPTLQVGQKYLFSIEGISRDLTRLYCIYLLGSDPPIGRLGTFDIETSQEIAFTEDLGLVHFAYGYAQYHDMLYTINLGSGEYSHVATLVDMSTVTSLLDFDQNPDWKRKLTITPFGEHFVLGSRTQIILLSPTGEVLQRYPLPEKWIGQQYKIMIFTK